MKYKIGFAADEQEEHAASPRTEPAIGAVPKKSLVQVYFPDRGMPLTYYNDMFDLHRGDRVYVDGKLEGMQGIIVDVNYSFKIKLSNYKRVISRVDADVRGRFYMADSHFVTFDRTALPAAKAVTWFKAPVDEEDEYVIALDGAGFLLGDLTAMDVSAAVAERGNDYFKENKVTYVCVDGIKGYAIVEGTSAYEVEFELKDGRISNLICSCYCNYTCKHEVAAMIQLRSTLKIIEEHYRDEYKRSEYFAAVSKGAFFTYVIDSKESGYLEI